MASVGIWTVQQFKKQQNAVQMITTGMFDKRDKLSQTNLPLQLSVFSISEGIPLHKHHWGDCLLYVFSAKKLIQGERK